MLFISVLWPTNHLAVFICQRSSNLSGKCIIHYFSDFSKWWDFDDTLSKFQIKSCVTRFSIDIRSTCLVKMLFYKVNKVLKKLLLTILCNCQENTSAGAPFIIRISWSCRPATIFVPTECPCRLCKKYIGQVGFIWFTWPFCNISEEKKTIYIFYIFWNFLYTYYICLMCSMGRFCLVSRRGDSSKGLRTRCISWGFPCWGIGWNFCIFCSGCHHLLYLSVCLLSVYLLLLLSLLLS